MKQIQKLPKEELNSFIQLVFKISANIQLLSESLDEMNAMGYKEVKLNQSIKNSQIHLHNVLTKAMKVMPEHSELIHYSNVNLLENSYVEFIKNNVTFNDLNK